jgi:hypothetical protein
MKNKNFYYFFFFKEEGFDLENTAVLGLALGLPFGFWYNCRSFFKS